MNVSHADLELILNPRIRQRTFQLPVRYGQWGERKRCPARKGGVYTLRANPEYQRYRVEARNLPSQRAAVLWVIGCCERHVLPGVVVTVSGQPKIAADGLTWVVRFVKGDRGDVMDRPRLMAANPGGVEGDYITAASMAVPGSAEEIQAPIQAKYAASSWQARTDGLSEQRARIQAAVATARLEAARQNVGTAAVRKRLKSLEHHLRVWEQEARRSA